MDSGWTAAVQVHNSIPTAEALPRDIHAIPPRVAIIQTGWKRGPCIKIFSAWLALHAALGKLSHATWRIPFKDIPPCILARMLFKLVLCVVMAGMVTGQVIVEYVPL